MIEPSKNIIVLSSPETEPKWPEWPGYQSPYTIVDLRNVIVTFGGHRWVDFYEVVGMVNTFDSLLSKAQFENWQLHGLLKGKRQTPPDATLKDEPVAQ